MVVDNGQQPQSMVVRKEFGAEDLARRGGETAMSAMAEQAKTVEQAAYIIAMQNPRSWDQVRLRLLKECARPGFADVAIYRKPVGDGIEGPSIRFAEAALRCMTNVDARSFIIYDDDTKRIFRVTVRDLESNLAYHKDVIVEKTVERRTLKKGQAAIRTRVNSYGDVVYIVPATEDDLLNKAAALESKAIRGPALRILPGDILDECMRACYATRADRDAKDPDQARRDLVDWYARKAIMPADLAKYLGHDSANMSKAEMQELRSLATAIHDGETTWAAALEHRLGADPDAKPIDSGSKLKDKVREKAQAAKTVVDATATATAAVGATEAAEIAAKEKAEAAKGGK